MTIKKINNCWLNFLKTSELIVSPTNLLITHRSYSLLIKLFTQHSPKFIKPRANTLLIISALYKY